MNILMYVLKISTLLLNISFEHFKINLTPFLIIAIMLQEKHLSFQIEFGIQIVTSSQINLGAELQEVPQHNLSLWKPDEELLGAEGARILVYVRFSNVMKFFLVVGLLVALDWRVGEEVGSFVVGYEIVWSSKEELVVVFVEYLKLNVIYTFVEDVQVLEHFNVKVEFNLRS